MQLIKQHELKKTESSEDQEKLAIQEDLSENFEELSSCLKNGNPTENFLLYLFVKSYDKINENEEIEIQKKFAGVLTYNVPKNMNSMK